MIFVMRPLNRQQAVRELAKQSQLVLVIGSKNSSNSNRLAELASRMGVQSRLIDGPEDIDASWLEGVETIGITAGASAPEVLVQSVILHLKGLATEVANLEGLKKICSSKCQKELRELTKCNRM